MVGLCDLQEAQLAVFRGDTVEAVEKLTEIGAVPREGEPIVTMVRAIALADLARDREAWAALTGAPEPVAPAFAELHHYARGEVLMCGGRPAEALAAFSAAACSGAVFLQETGELPAARAWAELEAGSPVTVLETPPSRALVRLASSVQTQAIDALAGARHEEAEALFGEAAAIWRRLFRREEHRCLWGACEAMRRMGDDARARDGLLRLERSAVRCGYVALTRRIHQTLRLIGERRSAPRTRTGVLTGRQRETLQLVAEGLTTPAIARRLGVSRHTVDSQIASAMMKLGARTRRQAALMSAGLAPG